jgi:molybdenum cofactor biosynthesis enzyme MoaA
LHLTQELRSSVSTDISLRLSTNGLGNVLWSRDITADLCSAGIKGVTVALNTSCAKQYDDLMQPQTPGASLEAVCEFVRACIRTGKLDVEVKYRIACDMHTFCATVSSIFGLTSL